MNEGLPRQVDQGATLNIEEGSLKLSTRGEVRALSSHEGCEFMAWDVGVSPCGVRSVMHSVFLLGFGFQAGQERHVQTSKEICPTSVDSNRQGFYQEIVHAFRLNRPTRGTHAAQISLSLRKLVSQDPYLGLQ